MSNKLLIAAAGSGKTTHIVKKALEMKEQRILITTFTETNEHEIEKKFYEINGCIPHNVVIQTWFSFLLEHGAKPYQGVLTDKRINFILLVNERSGFKATTRHGPIYWGEDENFDRHYFTNDYKIFTDKLSKFVFRCNEKSCGAVIKRISDIFTDILIDEVQDMAGYDLELIKLLMQSSVSLFMVGDPRQTTYHTHCESKYSKYTNGEIINFISAECKYISCEIDTTSLNTSYRNNQFVCTLANQLFPNLPASEAGQTVTTEHDGLFLVRPSDVERYLRTYAPVQLRDSVRTLTNPNYCSMNFGNSKGLTFERVLIFPTSPLVKWLKNHDSELAEASRCKFYVAVTRAKYSVGIIMDYAEKTNIEGVYKFKFDDNP
jgi:DNA helicase-2/ATP-dependent DNA helicase PcrA